MDTLPSNRRRHTAAFFGVLAFSLTVSVVAQTPQGSPSAHPDFAGAWSSATAIPLERPARLKDKPFYTREEADELQKKARGVNDDPLSRLETGSLMQPSLRTSLITDPPNGLLPSLTPSAAAAQRTRVERLHNPSTATDMGLQDRCLVFPTAVPPMIPYRYNSNYQIVQTGDTVVVVAEMIHAARIIRLDRRTHLSSNLRQWLGDSVGHWEGATLVVDTTNFNDAGGFYGDAGGMYGWDRNMHVVERFSLLDANTILYRFEVEDPTAYTQPWKGELTMTRTPTPPFEYACHEGNRDLPNILQLSTSQP
ncbi:MAG TPA: hypothetical protein VKR43_00945 [Bryobacteraceae bacterium]|nr:hypothetical protein [Bryobacteraceae bacterium]